MLAQLFEDEGDLALLQQFTCDIACNRYGLKKSDKKIVLERKDWTVPQFYSSVKPFLAGATLRWRMAQTPNADSGV